MHGVALLPARRRVNSSKIVFRVPVVYEVNDAATVPERPVISNATDVHVAAPSCVIARMRHELLHARGERSRKTAHHERVTIITSLPLSERRHAAMPVRFFRDPITKC